MANLSPESELEHKSHPASGKKIEDRLDELEILVRQNMQWSEIIYHDVKKIKRRLLISQIWGMIKITLLLLPIIAAVIFLPPYYREAKQWYETNIEKPRKQLENNINKINQYLPNN